MFNKCKSTFWYLKTYGGYLVPKGRDYRTKNEYFLPLAVFLPGYLIDIMKTLCQDLSLYLSSMMI